MMDNKNDFQIPFDEKFRQMYQEGKTEPTDKRHSFITVTPQQTLSPQPVEGAGEVASPAKELALQTATTNTIVLFGHTIDSYINALLPNGVPEGTRHKAALSLANDLMVMLDGDSNKVQQVLLSQKWVQDVITERGEDEINKIIEAASKQMHKRETENLYTLLPSKRMGTAIKKVTGKPYRVLMAEQSQGNTVKNDSQTIVIAMAEQMGGEIKKLFHHYPLLKLLCHGLKSKHYVAAMFAGGAFGMTLMTRCWYRFYPSPGKKCRMNCILEVIGPPASGKNFVVQLKEIMMKPITDADQAQIDALNQWNTEQTTAGANKTKKPRPQGIYRCLPAESSASAIREAEMNAVETIAGEEWATHVFLFDSELDNTIRQMKKDYMDITTLYLKGFHNEPHGIYLRASTSQVGEYNVHLNAVYTGTEYALDKQVNADSFPTGLPQRLTIVPMANTNYEMMENRQYTAEDQTRDSLLSEWSYKLDKCKGEIPVKMLSDKLYNWTKSRMADAEENDSKIEEALLKRCAWHGINYAIPFIVSRHWSEMTCDEDGRWKAGVGFKVDKTDWKLCQLLVNAQYAFQLYYVGPVAEKFYDNRELTNITNHQLQSKTKTAFAKLPEIFTLNDVMLCYGYNSTGSCCSRLKRLQDDGMAEKIRNGEDKGKYRKLLNLTL